MQVPVNQNATRLANAKEHLSRSNRAVVGNVLIIACFISVNRFGYDNAHSCVKIT